MQRSWTWDFCYKIGVQKCMHVLNYVKLSSGHGGAGVSERDQFWSKIAFLFCRYDSTTGRLFTRDMLRHGRKSLKQLGGLGVALLPAMLQNNLHR